MEESFIHSSCLQVRIEKERCPKMSQIIDCLSVLLLCIIQGTEITSGKIVVEENQSPVVISDDEFCNFVSPGCPLQPGKKAKFSLTYEVDRRSRGFVSYFFHIAGRDHIG